MTNRLSWLQEGISPIEWAQSDYALELEAAEAGDFEGAVHLRNLTHAAGLELIRRGYPMDAVLDAYNDVFKFTDEGC